jgi:hypothetical protein
LLLMLMLTMPALPYATATKDEIRLFIIVGTDRLAEVEKQTTKINFCCGGQETTAERPLSGPGAALQSCYEAFRTTPCHVPALPA